MIKLSSLLIEQTPNPYRKLFTYIDKKISNFDYDEVLDILNELGYVDNIDSRINLFFLNQNDKHDYNTLHIVNNDLIDVSTFIINDLHYNELLTLKDVIMKNTFLSYKDKADKLITLLLYHCGDSYSIKIEEYFEYINFPEDPNFTRRLLDVLYDKLPEYTYTTLIQNYFSTELKEYYFKLKGVTYETHFTLENLNRLFDTDYITWFFSDRWHDNDHGYYDSYLLDSIDENNTETIKKYLIGQSVFINGKDILITKRNYKKISLDDMEDLIKENDIDNLIERAVGRALEDDDYSSKYNSIKKGLENIGNVIGLDDDGCKMTVNISSFGIDDQHIYDLLINNCNIDKNLFGCLVYEYIVDFSQDYLELGLPFSDQWTPDWDIKTFNDNLSELLYELN